MAWVHAYKHAMSVRRDFQSNGNRTYNATCCRQRHASHTRKLRRVSYRISRRPLYPPRSRLCSILLLALLISFVSRQRAMNVSNSLSKLYVPIWKDTTSTTYFQSALTPPSSMTLIHPQAKLWITGLPISTSLRQSSALGLKPVSRRNGRIEPRWFARSCRPIPSVE